MSEERDPVVALFGAAVRLLVDSPEDVTVTVHRIATRTIIEIDSAPEDTGKIIGKMGKTAMALRQLLSAMSGRFNVNYQLEVKEHGSKS
jgi:hypothetical protein